MTGVFIILATLTIAGAVAAMALRNLIHAVLVLVLTFVGLATLYLSLGAQFLGFAQVLVYVGAVAILTVFAILLTRGNELVWDQALPGSWIAGLAIATAVFCLLVRSISTSSVSRLGIRSPPQATVRHIGDALMSSYVLPLELLGLLLTGALLGAVIIAMHDRTGRR